MAIQEENKPLTIADAVFEILNETGISILMDARGFLGALLDMDVSGPEIRMLRFNLNDDVLRPFQQILETEEILYKERRVEATGKAVYTLVHEQGVDATTARNAISLINEGIERYLVELGAIKEEQPNKHVESKRITESVDEPAPSVEKQEDSIQGVSEEPTKSRREEKTRQKKSRPHLTIPRKPIPWKRVAAALVIISISVCAVLGIRAGSEYFERMQQVVRFDGNGADSGVVESISFAEGGPVVLPDNSFSRAGYQFVGWSESKEGDGLLEPGFEFDASEPTTLYAAWGAIVSFDGNGADGGEANESIVAAPDGTVTLPKSTFKRAGFRIWGWSDSEKGEQTLAGNTEVVVDGPTTFYAIWRALVSFKGNGATDGATKAVAENTKGDVTLPECGFVRAGCSFIGWYRAAADFEQHPYYNDKDLMQPGKTFHLGGKPMRLYACWKYDDATVADVHVDEISRDGKQGKTYILLLRNDTDFVMDLEGEMRYVSQDGKTLGSAPIGSPYVAPGETVAQTFADYDLGSGGKFEYTLAARPPRHGNKSLGSCISKGELKKDGGMLSQIITNTSKDSTVHIIDAKAYGYQSGMATTGGFAYCGGGGYEDVLAPGESTTIYYGDKDWQAPWSGLTTETYLDGYAE